VYTLNKGLKMTLDYRILKKQFKRKQTEIDRRVRNEKTEEALKRIRAKLK